MNLKTTLKTVIAVSALSFASLSLAAGVEVNADSNDLAIKGYDPVAYFVDNNAVQGNAQYSAAYNDAIYYFSSAEHRDLFKQSPAKYAPQFGGYCAFGVTKQQKFDVDPEAFKIVEGKLYLNLNKNVQKRWIKDIPGNVSEGNEIWQEIAHSSAEYLSDQ